MHDLEKQAGKKYSVRLTDTPSDILAAQKLRHLAFGLSAPSGIDADNFDPVCTHVLVEEQKQTVWFAVIGCCT